MNLSPEDAALFFKLMWALQFYVNNRLNIMPDVESIEAYIKLPQEEKAKVREVLYEHMELLDAFVSENPSGLSPDELQIVQSWKRRVAGDFYLMRFLKRYTIFMPSTSSPQVYGVLGLYDSIEEMLYPQRPPILVKAVLLPFKGRIIYDGMLSVYPIHFGPGIWGDLNELYQRARQAGKIIESLEPGAETARKRKPKKPARDWRPVLDSVVETTEKLRQAETTVQARAFSVLKASARLAQAAAHDPKDLDELNELAKRTDRALRQLETALVQAEWIAESNEGPLAWD